MNVKIPRYAKIEARNALKEREALPKSRRFGIDKAEAEAYRRAVQGYEQDVWYQGVKVGEQRMYSDQLLALILKGNRKRVYSDRTEHTGADGGPLEIKTIERVILKPNE